MIVVNKDRCTFCEKPGRHQTAC